MNTTSAAPKGEAPLANVIMVGMMGCGKSAIGRKIAENLNLSFVDTDEMIVEEAGRSIPEIFEDEGEANFRLRERRVLESLMESSGQVIATGGGIVLDPRNREILSKLGYVVWLTASVDKLLFRISQNRQRPLMQTPNPRETLVALLDARQALYEEVAEMVVDTSELTMCETVHGVVETLNYQFGCHL